MVQQSLHGGMTINDLKVVNLQLRGGFAALRQSQVDAWMGNDPQTAQAEIAADRAIFSDKTLRESSVLSVPEEFLDKHPKASNACWVFGRKHRNGSGKTRRISSPLSPSRPVAIRR
ncbi:hypothetical protein ACRQ1B_24400 [Rhizobium panacihumi]|uniref:hypothetical protein n=1 Tax=Rhizobium panacihumi TaxID=2008450 RepID=UPI003D7AE2BA